MFPGYMKLNDTEILNAARTKVYASRFLPDVTVKCDARTLQVALAHSPYFSPKGDFAPWYRADVPASERFYGFFPLMIQGADDSTQSISTTELTGDGAVHVSPRYGVREIRVKTTALALDEEAMSIGLAWLRDTLANDGCRDGYGCTGREITLLNSEPLNRVDAVTKARHYYQVEVQEGPKVTKQHPSKAGYMYDVEFTLVAGIPWQFTELKPIATLNMDNATNFQDPVGENCAVTNAGYANFINDPYFTAIAQPPQPPNILPPNLITITSWRRLTASIEGSVTTRPGRATPVITVVAGAVALQYLRLRIYREDAGLTGCDYDGEFLISYIPALSTLKIDAVRKEISVTLSDGRVVPGGHLLYGSGGRPFIWPSLACHLKYNLTADLFPGQTGISVTMEMAVRE